MINLYILISLLIIAFLNQFILNRLKNNTTGLKNSILFLVNSIAIIVLLNWFIENINVESLTDPQLIDKLIFFNSIAIRVRNTVILVSLAYLSYGTFQEYVKGKKRIWLLVSIILTILSILFLITVIIAGAFII